MSTSNNPIIGTIQIPSTGGKVHGFVVAMQAYSPDRAPALAVQILVPSEIEEKRLQWFSTYEVKDNRELIWVSILRDAMVHSLPISLSYDNLRQIVVIETRSPVYHTLGERITLSGIINEITVNEVGLWKENIDTPDTATIVMTAPNKSTRITGILAMQSPDKDIKIAQLEILRQAYHDQSLVTITCCKMPVMGNSKKTVNVITGVQVGSDSKSILTRKRTPAGKSER